MNIQMKMKFYINAKLAVGENLKKRHWKNT